MNTKKLTSLVLAAGLCASVFSSCGSTGSETKSDNSTQSSTGASSTESSGADDSEEVQEISLFNGKSEIADQLLDLAAAYEKKTGVKVNVETAAAGVDSQAKLKAYFLSDKMPDIFVCEGASFESWEGLLADLSGESWVSDTDAAYTDKTYGTVGFPYTTEAIGLTYNADLLEKAGIDPASLTGPSQIRSAFEKLDKQKASLGLTSVVGYYVDDENLSWSTGNHLFGAYLDSGLARDDTTYLDMIENDQSLDSKRFSAYADFVKLLSDYSDQDNMIKGTYEQQVEAFASGKYAFITQGSWIGSLLTSTYKDAYQKAGNFKVGMLPYAFEDGIDTILTSSPSWWAVLKEGHTDAAKAFLSWCAGDEGQKILVEEANCISPFKSCSYVASDPFSEVLSGYISSGKTSSWHWMNLKEGIASNATGALYREYAEGKMTPDTFTQQMEETIRSYYKSM
uniref:ABC-type sugar transport system, periplasmic component n=1 Tax=Eubacterium cellulosolvens (strain ATCC 43171 / JCM 9499 / 6) TaxID=633697 RepID=I5ATR6_EUBC6